jgi:hypothetical protein
MQLGGTERYHNYSGPLDCLRQTVRQEGLRGLMRGLGGTMAREMPGNAVCELQPAAVAWCSGQAGGTVAAASGVCIACFPALHDSTKPAPPSADFGTYRLLRHWLPGKAPGDTSAGPSQPAGLLQALADAMSAVVCGGLAGMVMWAAILPLDAAKTRIQTAYPGSPHDVGVLRQLRLIHREGGLWLCAQVCMRADGRWCCRVCHGVAVPSCLDCHAIKATSQLLPACLPACLPAGGVQALYAGLTPTLARAFPANAAQWLAWELCLRQLQRWDGGSSGGGGSGS